MLRNNAKGHTFKELRVVNIIFSLILLVVLLFIILFSAKILPEERWQMVATVPFKKNEDGSWVGANLTFYGAISALSYVFSVAVFFFLTSSIGISPLSLGLFIFLLLAVCAPASSMIAGIVEKKKHTFSVAAAFFTGVVVAPFLVMLINFLFSAPKYQMPVLAALSAISIAYTLGEGLGRLACLSFGCCYGKPMEDAPSWLRAVLGGRGIIFKGKTKKISYAHNLDNHKVIPVQVMTSVIYSVAGVAGIYLFLIGHRGAALLLTIFVTQVWRLYSETLRHDHRGGGKISVYQIMSIVSIIYSAFLINFIPNSGVTADIKSGGLALWDPIVLVALQILFLIIFLYMGISKVTDSRIELKVMQDRI